MSTPTTPDPLGGQKPHAGDSVGDPAPSDRQGNPRGWDGQPGRQRAGEPVGEGGGASSEVDAGDALACGRPVDAVVDQVAAGAGADLDAHQRSCPFCQAALAETVRLWAPLLQTAATPVAAPSGDLVERIIKAVRALARHSTYIQIEASGSQRGSTRLAATAINDIAQHAAAQVRGVRVVFGRLGDDSSRPATGTGRSLDLPDSTDVSGSTQTTGPTVGVTPGVTAGGEGTSVAVSGQSVVVDLAVIVDLGAVIPEVATRIREQVARTLARLASTRPTRINIHVHDVLPPASLT